jgi:excisionase family DNA binding protein
MPKKARKYCTVSKPNHFCDDYGFTIAYTVEAAAEHFLVSTRRIRQLLNDGKLKGTKHGRAWRVKYPYELVIGTRGPLSIKAQSRRAGTFKQSRPARNGSSFENPKLKKGD